MGTTGNPKTIIVVDTKDSSIKGRILGGLVIGTFIITWVSSIFSPLLLIAALVNGYYSVAVVIGLVSIAAYTPWEPSTISQLVKNTINNYHPLYYSSCRMEFEQELPSQRRLGGAKSPTFYAVHPHGAFSLGWANLYTAPCMSHVRFCFAPALYLTPFFRLFSRCAGRPGTADKADMTRYMKRGEDLALPPGGFEEATLTSLDTDRVYIKKRTGFIRLCLQYGYSVVPVYAFGERRLFWNLQGFWPFRLGLNRFAIPAIVIWGNPLLPLLPRHSVDLRIVGGAPIQLPRIENPTKQDVEYWHGKYVAALLKLYDDHKEDAYGSEEAKTLKLEIW